jgi:hypothetical protein
LKANAPSAAQHLAETRIINGAPLHGKPDLLKWQPSDFSTKPCAYLKTNLAACVGAEISPEGALQP